MSSPASDSLPPNRLPVPAYDLAMVTELLQQRRSVFPREYTEARIPDAQIELMLQNAHWAPTHGRTEPWFFKVFSDGALARFGEQHAALYRQETAEADFEQKKYEKLKRRPTECSHLMAICLRRGDNPKIPEIEEIAAVAIAVHNMPLTATAMGIGAYWSSGGMTYPPAMNDLLGLREQDRCLGFFHLGMPARHWPPGGGLSDWDAHVAWERE